jgi:DNA recombination protein RmuC
MYLNDSNLLILAAIIGCALFIALIASLSTLRREKNKCMRLGIKEELYSKEIAALLQTSERLREERNHQHQKNSELATQLASLTTTLTERNKQVAARNELLETTRQEMEKNFQLMAEKIFTEKGTTITRNQQEELTKLLQPVREQLGDFKKKVEDVYDRETRDRVSLVKEIEHLKTLNQQISEDAINLTNALKGQSKTQGMWGEMILERLLENSGLKQGHEFDIQSPLKDKNGQLRIPDVLIHLPRDREIIIDSKVSLKAYEKVCRADNREEEKGFIQQHLNSIKQHIKDLSDKQYHLLEGINSLDFIILFIPTEGAFQTAISSEPGLLTTAMQKKIILASPSTLIAILRTIHHLWRQEEQTRNSLIIAKQAGNLYDKFIGFLDSFEEVGSRLHQTQSAWEIARNRLVSGKGNLVSRAEGLKTLGVQSSKTMPSSIDVENLP